MFCFFLSGSYSGTFNVNPAAYLRSRTNLHVTLGFHLGYSSYYLAHIVYHLGQNSRMAVSPVSSPFLQFHIPAYIY